MEKRSAIDAEKTSRRKPLQPPSRSASGSLIPAAQRRQADSELPNRWNLPFGNRRMLQSKAGDLLAINIRLNDTLFVPTKMLAGPLFLPAHWAVSGGYHPLAERRKEDAVYSVSRSLVLSRHRYSRFSNRSSNYRAGHGGGKLLGRE
jgi:hypothetical protein